MSLKFDICIYHANCADGFTAAWVIQRRYPGIVCIPCQYGQPFPDIETEGKAIIIADFSFPPEVLEPIAKTADCILMLDHHKTARDMLEGLPKIARPRSELIHEEIAGQIVAGDGRWQDRVLVEFDMDRSGAGMAADFCEPDFPRQRIVDHVEDRDLWRFSIEHTREVSAYLQSIDRDFGEWTKAAAAIEWSTQYTVDTGAAILRYQRKIIEEIVEGARREFFYGHDDVPVCHCPYAFASDAGNALLARYPDAPFAVAAVFAHDGVTYSLRSTNDRLDVSELAKQHGGGGHRNAAGFRLNLDQ